MRRVIKIEPFLYSADKLRKCIVQRNNIDLVLYLKRSVCNMNYRAVTRATVIS